MHALSTGTGLERIDAAVASGEVSGEALAGLLCEAMERDGGLSRRAFSYLRSSAPTVLAEAFDAKAGSRDETPMDLVGLTAVDAGGDGGRRGRLDGGARTLRAAAGAGRRIRLRRRLLGGRVRQ